MSVGIQQTKEVVVAVNEVSVLLIKLFKDGVQVSDFAALLAAVAANEELKGKIVAAGDAVAQVPSEVKDIDLQEGLELATVQLSYIPKIVEALKA